FVRRNFLSALFRRRRLSQCRDGSDGLRTGGRGNGRWRCATAGRRREDWIRGALRRSEEHTSELQSRFDLVCRLLPEKKKRVSPSLTSLPTERSRSTLPLLHL